MNAAGDPNDPNTAIIGKYEYDPYGNNLLDPNDPNESGIFAHANPFRFSTKYFDVETGLAYFGGRYYHGALGRWLNRDPLGELGGVNLYAYAGNDPVDHIDPLGHAWTKCRGPHCGHDDPDDGAGRCPKKGQPASAMSPSKQPAPQVPENNLYDMTSLIIKCTQYCAGKGYKTEGEYFACRKSCVDTALGRGGSMDCITGYRPLSPDGDACMDGYNAGKNGENGVPPPPPPPLPPSPTSKPAPPPMPPGMAPVAGWWRVNHPATGEDFRLAWATGQAGCALMNAKDSPGYGLCINQLSICVTDAMTTAGSTRGDLWTCVAQAWGLSW